MRQVGAIREEDCGVWGEEEEVQGLHVGEGDGCRFRRHHLWTS